MSDSPTRNHVRDNPLWEYFSQHDSGPGIWKWAHYFDVYHRHLAQFRGTAARVAEIGVFSGGSLGMWTSYFGPDARIFGIDIQEECRVYEGGQISILIGDQSNRSFWADFKATVPGIEVLIDDGGHTPEQQRVTLEEMLPFLSEGGVYICEDVHGVDNAFADYVTGLVMQLNHYRYLPDEVQRSELTDFQRSIYSIHFYPYLIVIEKRTTPLKELTGPRRGSEWAPPDWTEGPSK